MKLKSFFFIAFVMLGFAAQAQMSLSVSPGRIFFDTKSPRKTERIRLQNNSKESTTWLISMQDWDRDSTGKKRFYAAGSRPHSCANAVRVFPTSITVAPGAAGEVTVTLDPSVQLTERDTALSSMIMVTQADDASALKANSGKEAVIKVKGEFAVHLYVQNSNAKKAISLVSVRHTADTSADIQLKVQNTGLLPLEAKVKVEISDKISGREWKLNEIPCTVLPGGVRICRAQLPKDLPKGRFLAIAIVDGGDDLPVRIGELEFEKK